MRERIKQLREKLSNQKGFTLIELMATLAILAMVVAIAVPAVGKIMQNAEAQAIEANIAMIEDAGEMAYLGGGATNSAEVDDGVEYTVDNLIDAGYLTFDVDAEGEDGTGVVKRNDTGTFSYTGPLNTP